MKKIIKHLIILNAIFLIGGIFADNVNGSALQPYIIDSDGSSTLANRGLISYWSFDEGAGTQVKDRAGNYDGQIDGTKRKWTDGLIGKALEFTPSMGEDGTAGVIINNSQNNFNFSDGFTIECIIKVNDFNSYYPTIISKGDSARRLQSNSGHNNLDFDLGKWDNSNYINIKFSNNFLDNNFHHVVVTWDGSYVKNFVDGALVETVTNGTLSDQVLYDKILNNNKKVVIGNNSKFNNKQRTFNGVIDEVAIYNTPLSENDIKTHFNNVKDGFNYFHDINSSYSCNVDYKGNIKIGSQRFNFYCNQVQDFYKSEKIFFLNDGINNGYDSSTEIKLLGRLIHPDQYIYSEIVLNNIKTNVFNGKFNDGPSNKLYCSNGKLFTKNGRNDSIAYDKLYLYLTKGSNGFFTQVGCKNFPNRYYKKPVLMFNISQKDVLLKETQDGYILPMASSANDGLIDNDEVEADMLQPNPYFQPTYIDVYFMQLTTIGNLIDSLEMLGDINLQGMFEGSSSYNYYQNWILKSRDFVDKISFIDSIDRSITLKDIGLANDMIKQLMKRLDCKYWGNLSHCNQVVLTKVGKFQFYELDEIFEDVFSNDGDGAGDIMIKFYKEISKNQLNVLDQVDLGSKYLAVDLFKNLFTTKSLLNDNNKYLIGYGMQTRYLNLLTLKSNFRKAIDTKSNKINLMGLYNFSYEVNYFTKGVQKILGLKTSTETNLEKDYLLHELREKELDDIISSNGDNLYANTERVDFQYISKQMLKLHGLWDFGQFVNMDIKNGMFNNQVIKTNMDIYLVEKVLLEIAEFSELDEGESIDTSQCLHNEKRIKCFNYEIPSIINLTYDLSKIKNSSRLMREYGHYFKFY